MAYTITVAQLRDDLQACATAIRKPVRLLAGLNERLGRYEMAATGTSSNFEIVIRDLDGLVTKDFKVTASARSGSGVFRIGDDGAAFGFHIRGLLRFGLRNIATEVLALHNLQRLGLAAFDGAARETCAPIFEIVLPAGDEIPLACVQFNCVARVRAAITALSATRNGALLVGSLHHLGEKVIIAPIEQNVSHTVTKSSADVPALIYLNTTDLESRLGYWSLGAFDGAAETFTIAKTTFDTVTKSVAGILFHELLHVLNEKRDPASTLLRQRTKTHDIWDHLEEEEAIKGKLRAQALSVNAVRAKITECHFLTELGMPIRYGHHTGGANAGKKVALAAFLDHYGWAWGKEIVKGYRKKLAAELTAAQRRGVSIAGAAQPRIVNHVQGAGNAESMQDYEPAAAALKRACDIVRAL